jgi:TonB family protein
MPRRSHTLAIALCASLALHGAIVYWGLHALITSKIWLAGFDRKLVEQEPQSGAAPAAQLFVDTLPDTALGSEDGRGHSINPAPGDRPLEARKGEQDQQFLSRDPAGAGKIGDDPSPAILPPSLQQAGESTPPGAPAFGIASAAPTPQVPARMSPRQPSVSGSGDSERPNPSPSKPDPPDMLAIASADSATPAPPPQPTSPPTAAPAASPAENASNNASNLPAADPAPLAESETDPFSVSGAVRFRAGKSDVQLGRKHKVVRPRFDIGAQSDMLKLRTPLVVALKIELDATGKVTHVDFARSSGSEAIDQAIMIAVYQWWIEPTKDKSGRPVKDLIPFVIRLD